MNIERGNMKTHRTEQINIRVTPALKMRLQRAAKDEHRSMAGYIVFVLARHVGNLKMGPNG